MANQLQYTELSYDFAKVVPENDPEMVYFDQFKQTFGEDGNLMVIGVADSAVYQPLNFKRYKFLSDYVENIPGVTGIISLPNLQRLEKNTETKSFDTQPIFSCNSRPADCFG